MPKLKELLQHPDEVLPMVRMYLVAKQVKKLPKDPDLAFCFNILNSVSRSFSIVINQLPPELRDGVCVFYLVLRALDTVEDDMSIPIQDKVPMLKDFYKKIQDPMFSMDYGTNYYQLLLKEFPKVNRVMMALDADFREVIFDITKRMGDGMAEFIEKDVVSVADYDLYCYYVAGLVGIGLSKLFAVAKLEKDELRTQEDLSRHMGLFLQKTNIIRDYLEDIMEEPAPRMFWPKDIWSLYADKLEDFKRPSKRTEALKCLNHLIVDVLRHIPSCFEYLDEIKTPDNFRFCAIPQVMAIATAALCFNNGNVFEGVVKVRRGETCKIFQDLHSVTDAYRMFDVYIGHIARKIPEAEMEEGVRKRALELVQQTTFLCKKRLKDAAPVSAINWTNVFLILLLGIVIMVLFSAATSYSTVDTLQRATSSEF